jgi:FlaA1/EpsC-like NDP-sugar epimerase
LEPDKNIPIVYTKPRPGEKLVEEILTAEEGTVATQNQKIFMAKLSHINQEKLNSGLKKLEKAGYNGDKETIIETLKELIPVYVRKN